jgi:ABC-type uncharacterized transport system substrate-binding protein
VLASKRLELLGETLPSATVIGVLVNPGYPNAEAETNELRVAAGALGVDLQVVKANTEGEFDAAFAALAQQRVAGLILVNDALFLSRREHVIALAARTRLVQCDSGPA